MPRSSIPAPQPTVTNSCRRITNARGFARRRGGCSTFSLAHVVLTPCAGAHQVRVLVAATVVFFVATTTFAANTDVIVLRNGDRFTGEVKELSHGKLKVTTDDIGTLYVEWDSVAAVTTMLQYEVVTTSGARYVGVLAQGSATDLRVIAADGSVTALPFLNVVSFASIKKGFLERIDGTLDVGGSYTKSVGVGQMMVNLDATYRWPSHNVFTTFESIVTRQSQPDQPDTVTQFTLRSGYTHFRQDGWIVSPFAFLTRNVDLGLSFGAAAVLTAGRYVQRSNRGETLVAFGGAIGKEALIDGRTISNVDAALRVATSFYRYNYPKTSFDLSLLMFPELNRLGRVRANLNGKVTRELFKDFIVAITAYDTFDNQPQVPGVSRNDIGISFSIGWTF